MTRQSVLNWCFCVFALMLVAYVFFVQWNADVERGVVHNPELVRWANRVVMIPVLGFGSWCVLLGTQTLRQGHYPPRGALVPFPHKRQENWNPVSSGLGLIFGGACTLATPLAVAIFVGW